jgi:hypothetical protein
MSKSSIVDDRTGHPRSSNRGNPYISDSAAGAAAVVGGGWQALRVRQRIDPDRRRVPDFVI